MPNRADRLWKVRVKKKLLNLVRSLVISEVKWFGKSNFFFNGCWMAAAGYDWDFKVCE